MKVAQRRIVLSALVSVLACSDVHGQVPMTTLPYLSVSTRTGARLGLKYMHEPDGATAATGTANVALY